MRRALLVAVVLLSGCALRSEPTSACSDPLRLYTVKAYEGCCVTHDEAYQRGGTEADRLAADGAFYWCVVDAGYTDDAATMFYAVRVGGGSRFTYRKGSR